MLLTLIIIAVCILIEQAAKFFLSFLPDFLTFSYNTGAAFSLFADFPELILILSGISCLILIFFAFSPKINFLPRLGLSIMSGGALSNFLERIFLGHVIDWIPSPFSFIEIDFNLADVEISMGALIIFFAFIQDPKG